MTDQVVATTKRHEMKYHYFKDPDSKECPAGEVVWVLQKGGVAVPAIGPKSREEAAKLGYVAWCPRPTRDKAIEEQFRVWD